MLGLVAIMTLIIIVVELRKLSKRGFELTIKAVVLNRLFMNREAEPAGLISIFKVAPYTWVAGIEELSNRVKVIGTLVLIYQRTQ